MSDYQGNIIIKNPATPTGPSAYGSAPGMWKLNEVAYWIKQGVWPNANIVPDQYFPYVSLLLSTTALGNANNNLFADSSGAFNPISRNGNTTQGSATPYGASWSNYFDGSGDFLSAPSNAAFDLGSSSFTVECWFNANSFAAGFGLISRYNYTSVGLGWLITIQNSTTVRFVRGNDIILDCTVSAMSTGVWYHVAAVRNGSTLTVYLNGVQVGQATGISNFTDAATALQIGRTNTVTNDINGYTSNVRIVKGTAVYTAAFTPPTSNLTAISGTSLLTCQSNRFIDNSTNNFTITVNGNTSVTEFSPFAPAYPGISYNQSDITNWSGYFDGSGDYLSLTDNAALQMGSGDFTTEFWWYPVSLSGFQTPFEKGYTGSGGLLLQTGNGDGRIVVYASGSAVITASTAPTLGAWNHMALVRSGTSLVLYLNGVSVGSATNSTNFNNTGSAGIGANVSGGGAGAYPVNGYMSNLRLVKGTAVYTSAFTPPTTNLTAISGTSLLTLQNAAFTDNSTNNFVVTINGNTTVTGNSPFNTVGYWSNYFDGTGDWLQATSPNLSGTWTVELWWFPASVTAQQTLISFNNGSFPGINIWCNPSSQLVVDDGANAQSAFTGGTFTAGRWNHVAVVRSGTTTTGYINGVAVGSNSFTPQTTSVVMIARYNQGALPLYTTGYISNVRVVNGSAVYTSGFTPPTSPLTAITNTSLLTCQNGRFIDNSTNAFTITVNGNTSVQSFDPFYTSTIASNGGSMYFDGSGDWLLSPSNPGFALGTGDFIVEVWANPSVQGGHGSGNNDCLIDFRSGNAAGAYGTLYLNSSGTYVGWYANAVNQILAPGIPNNAWSHIVVSRVSGTTRMFINGVQSGSFTDSINYLQGRVALGQFDDGVGAGWFQGYMSGVRIVKGTGISANFTPPTAPRTPTPATTLLLNGMNAGAYDATAINNMETVGNAQVSTAVSKFGGSSMYFDGTGDYLTSNAASDLYAFGTGDFTIEMWFNLSSVASLQILYDSRPTSTDGLYPLIYVASGGGSVIWQISAVARITGTATLSTGVWYHIAVSRSSGSTKMFLNGTQIGSTYADTNAYLNSGTTRPFIGGSSYTAGTLTVNGYIDDLRVTKGVARYTANFTPPTQAFLPY